MQWQNMCLRFRCNTCISWQPMENADVCVRFGSIILFLYWIYSTLILPNTKLRFPENII